MLSFEKNNESDKVLGSDATEYISTNRKIVNFLSTIPLAPEGYSPELEERIDVKPMMALTEALKKAVGLHPTRHKKEFLEYVNTHANYFFRKDGEKGPDSIHLFLSPKGQERLKDLRIRMKKIDELCRDDEG